MFNLNSTQLHHAVAILDFSHSIQCNQTEEERLNESATKLVIKRIGRVKQKVPLWSHYVTHHVYLMMYSTKILTWKLPLNQFSTSCFKMPRPGPTSWAQKVAEHSHLNYYVTRAVHDLYPAHFCLVENFLLNQLWTLVLVNSTEMKVEVTLF